MPDWPRTRSHCCLPPPRRTAGAAVCLAPVAVECPGGYEVTPDNSSCIRCLPGMNVSASEPYTCQGACKGERFNETCFASCNRGHSFHGGCRLLCDCTAG